MDRKVFKMLNFNESQEKVIKNINGPMLVVSCPGSGKTTTLIRRIHNMVESGVDPETILMVTFTKEAAKEMGDKYKKLFNEESKSNFMTIHALCRQILVSEGVTGPKDLFLETEQQELLKDYFNNNGFYDEVNDLIRATMSGITMVKNNYLNPASVNVNGISTHMFMQAFSCYEAERKKMHKIDFDDMLLMCKELLESNKSVLKKYQNKYKYIMCDEYQDTNYVQRDILYLLSDSSQNLCVVGDDDQSIYAFRGAKPEVMFSFSKHFPNAEIIQMGTNYRSAQTIITLSDNLIKNNNKRFEKEFISFRGNNGEKGNVQGKHFNDSSDEMKEIISRIRDFHSSGIPYSEMAILFRINGQAQIPIEFLSKANIPYYTQEFVKTIYEKSIFLDIKSYLTLAMGKGNEKDVRRIINHPNRYLKFDKFKDAQYDEWHYCRAASYLQNNENHWVYQKACEEIERWMRYFGPGAISEDTSTKRVFSLLSYIGYPEFIDEYAKKRNMDPRELYETYEKLKQDAFKCETVGRWLEYAEKLVKRVRTEVNKKDTNGVTVSTMHSSKGLEWKVVFLFETNELLIPYKLAKTEEEIAEERRLMYVAMTRAKDYLYIMWCGKPSMFIKELQGNMKNKGKGPNIRFHVGEMVEHKTFGKGQILTIENGIMTISFEKAGIKSISTNFAQEKPIIRKI